MANKKDIKGEAQDTGGKKKLPFILLIVALVLLAGGGGALAVWLVLGGSGGAADPNDPVQAIVEQEGEPLYHKLDPTFVVTLPPGGAAKLLQIAIQVYARQEDVMEFLEQNDPVIRHHLLNLLEAQDASALMTLEGKQALQQSVQDQLQERMLEMGQEGEIKGIYFTQFVLQ